MKEIRIPAVIGPGSQPESPDDINMSFMQMPSDMHTYAAPSVPEPEEAKNLTKGLALARCLLDALRGYRRGDAARVIEVDGLDEANLSFINQLLGEGEVSIQCQAPLNARIQESVLAGVWRLRYLDENGQIIRDAVEIGDVPTLVSELTFAGARDNIDLEAIALPEDVYNAPPLLAELNEHLPQWRPDHPPHIINLSLLPHTERDLAYLSEVLGIGPVVILSRGYGNCRISATGVRNLWWVQYFNSQETLILNTLEISAVPEVARAASEDIDDSAQRLAEILAIYAGEEG